MNYFDFPSLGSPKEIGYRFHDDSTALWDQYYRAAGAVCAWAGTYLTYGDSNTPHSHTSVLLKTKAGDFLGSLACYLFEKEDDPDYQKMLRIVAHRWPDMNRWQNRQAIVFAIGLRPKKVPEGKLRNPLYYNLASLKTSSAESKRYDKRWQEVPDWADGSLEATVRLLRGDDRYDFFETYAQWEYVERVMREEGLCWPSSINEELGITDDSFNQAFDAVDCLVKSYRLKDDAKRISEAWKHNEADKRREEAAAKVEAAAPATT